MKTREKERPGVSMNMLGRLAFITLRPLIRRYLGRSLRAYVICEAQGRVLFVKGWLGRQLWQLPGGGARKNESPVQAAARELFEETGVALKPEQLKLVTEGQWQTDGLGQHYFIFSASLKSQPAVKVLRPELIATAWLEPGQINGSDCPQEIIGALKKANLL